VHERAHAGGVVGLANAPTTLRGAATSGGFVNAIAGRAARIHTLNR